MIVNQALQDYMTELTPLSHPVLQEMEIVAEEERVPIIDRSSIQFIRILLQSRGNISRILEVGTAIGYSALWFAQAVPHAVIDTIERDEQRADQARHFLKKAGVLDRVHIHLADATSYAVNLKDRQYDCIFIDAAKGQYQLFFEQYSPLLRSDGVIITDNVFFHGEVLKEHMESRRIRSLVKKIRSFNEWLSRNSQFETAFIPIGDGLAMSIIRREQT